MKPKLLTLSVALISLSAVAHAATILPTGYTYGAEGGGVNNDTGGGAATKLTDDTISTGDWNDGTNVGFDSSGRPGIWGSATFTFDALYDFTTIDIYQNNALGTATSVSVSTSIDNITFTSPTSYALSAVTQPTGNSKLRLDSVNVSGLADAQYLKLDFFNSAGSGWIMLNEVDFDGVAAVPEPSTVLLGAIGLLALLRRRRA